jgi:hypothetical protein
LISINATIGSEAPIKVMQHLFKTIGAVGILALTLAAVFETSDALADTDSLPDQTVCRAINSERSGWVEGFYAEEASRRGLTFRHCDEMNNAPARADTGRSGPTYNPPAGTAQRNELRF